MKWSVLILGFICLLNCTNNTNSRQNNFLDKLLINNQIRSNLKDSIHTNLINKLDTFFLEKHLKTLFYGNVLFADKGEIIFKKSYGYANLKTKDTLTFKHTFQMASASKPFTAISILQLCEKGLLDLEDSVKKYIPNFPYNGIDIHQLLCHRSGMSQYTHFCDYPDSIWPDKNKTITNDDVIKIMFRNNPLINYPPNKKHYYCNTNYILLASIVEKISGISFSDYLNKYIFKPAGMKSTVLFTRDNQHELINPVIGYYGSFQPADNIYLNGCTGDKGVYSNIHDLLAFDRALKNEILIRGQTFELAVKNHNEMFNENRNYGYGFRIVYSQNKGKIVYHTGWWKGFRTYFIKILEKDQTIIVLTNIKRGTFLNIEELANLLP